MDGPRALYTVEQLVHPDMQSAYQQIDLGDWSFGGLESLFPGELGSLLGSLDTENRAQHEFTEEDQTQSCRYDTANPEITEFPANKRVDVGEASPGDFQVTPGDLNAFNNIDDASNVNEHSLLDFGPQSSLALSYNYSGNADIPSAAPLDTTETFYHESQGSGRSKPPRNWNWFPRDVEESDSSWDIQDDLGGFSEHISECLDQLNAEIEKHFVTPFLNRRKRRIVHALAHLRRFNHMTIDAAKEGRVLVSTARIGSKGDQELRKCWNSTKTHWRLDPYALVLAVAPQISHNGIEATLSARSLPVPRSYYQLLYSHRHQKRIFVAEFGTVSIAAWVFDRIQAKSNTMENGINSNADIEVSFRYWNNTSSSDAVFQMLRGPKEQMNWRNKFLVLPHKHFEQGMAKMSHPPVTRGGMIADVPTHRSRSRPRSRSRRRNSRNWDSSEGDEDGNDSSASRGSSKRSHTVYMSDTTHGEEGSLQSEMAQQYDRASRDGSLDSIAKRRKRLPKQEGGYVCSEPGCGKTFDFNGERTKHERIHKPKEEYPHPCNYCDKRFIDRKDLQRHEKTHWRKWLPGGQEKRRQV